MKHGAKKKFKRCSIEGCTNQVINGGVCKRHGAKRECRHEGCTSHAVKGGVCIRHGAKMKRCISDGCANQAVKGGVCIKHGAKRKLCSVEGCTNHAKKGGVCRRHGAYRNPIDESTAFASCFGSEFDKTTVTHPNQRNSDSSSNQGSLPTEVVVLCGVVAENNYEEV